MQAYLARPSSVINTKTVTKTPDSKGNISLSSSYSSSNLPSSSFSSSSASSTAAVHRTSTIPATTTANNKGSTELKSAMAAVKAGGSSEASLASYMTATEGMTSKQKQAYLLKRRADEARLQQLRGIFATYDEDRDNELNEKELSLALLALGLDPSPRTLQRFYLASPTGKVDLATVSSRYFFFTLSSFLGMSPWLNGTGYIIKNYKPYFFSLHSYRFCCIPFFYPIIFLLILPLIIVCTYLYDPFRYNSEYTEYR